MPELEKIGPDVVPFNIPITAWVGAARADPVSYRSRQVTHILLSAIGLTPELKETMLLKGGALMMLAFKSPRATQDVDFTVMADPEPFASELEARLNPALLRATASLGYADLVCRVQKVKRRPRTEMFEGATGPALSITIAYARRGSGEERRLIEGQAVSVLQVDLSFKEPVLNAMSAQLEDTAVVIQTYAIEDVIAEKFRALLQQPERNRARRQDVFDLAWLANIDRSIFNADFLNKILTSLMEKSIARGINPTIESIDNPEVARRASSEWATLKTELEADLPPFDEAFATTRALYLSLPWEAGR